MKIIAMVPTRNEAWVIEHSLRSLSAFCDVILVSDRASEDGTREICRRFPKVVVLEPAADSRIREQRWQLLDAARDYDGHNLLWSNDADELISPRLVRAFLDMRRDALVPGVAVACRFYTLWGGPSRYRGFSFYQPYWNRLGFVDDRRADYDRSRKAPLHEPRTPADPDGPAVRGHLPMLHLQWLVPEHNQLKQAWYRCRELLDGGRPADINERYAVTFHEAGVLRSVPREWIQDLTFPGDGGDLVASWHRRELFTWFDEHGVERFEPLEIWHIGELRDEFERRVGRSPRPDRSYLPPWPVRAHRVGRRLLHSAWRRMTS